MSDRDDLADRLDAVEDDLRRDALEVNIRTWGVDLAENVDDVNTDEGIVMTAAGPCVVAGCDEWAIGPDIVCCITHCDGDRDTVRDD